MTYHEYQDAVNVLSDQWEYDEISDAEYYYQLGELKAELARSTK